MSQGWSAPPGRRPPWWPEGEPFQPRRWGRRGPAVFIRWIGCLFLGALGMAAITGGIIGAFIGRLGFLPAIVLAVVFVLLAGMVVTGGMRRVTRPMDRFIEAAGRIEAGDYSAEVPEWGPRELRSVARAFNSMSARLKKVDEQRRGFLADVAHELRTPLTVIRGQAEGIADGVYPGDAAHVAPILAAAETLDRLVEDLRTMVLSDAGNLVLHRETADVGTLVRETAESFKVQAESAGVALTVATAADVPAIEIDPARIRSAVGNLLSNAIRHTSSGGSVKVSVASTGAEVVTTVTDTGEGIPPDVLPHVLERFVKGPNSTGSGLGLAIAHDIIAAHGGAIDIESRLGAGTTVRARLPVVTGAHL
jgi:two-component system sensor histidine kinase BaeS